jgi:hypothetical protein
MTSLLLSTLKRLQQIVDGIFTIVRSTPAFFAPSPNSLRTISPSGDLSFSTHKNAHRLLLSKQPARAVHKSIRTFFLVQASPNFERTEEEIAAPAPSRE